MPTTAERLERVVKDALPNANSLAAEVFARRNAGATFPQLAKELEAFVRKACDAPEIPRETTPDGWKVRFAFVKLRSESNSEKGLDSQSYSDVRLEPISASIMLRSHFGGTF
jgi:hypothetical protein